MVTFGSILGENKGIGPGFDILRIALAVGVLAFHSFAIVGMGTAGPAKYVGSIIVPAFFALSGFLVLGSALRVKSLGTFLSFRGLRIAPALFAEVFITGVLIGPIVTNLPLGVYYTDPQFFTYFANLAGNIQMHLPGVFARNPMDVVNQSLWTVRPEIMCYLIMALMMLSGFYTEALGFVALAGALFAILGVGSVALANDPLALAGFASMTVNIFYFLVGNVFYHMRHRIPYSPRLFGVCAVFSLVMLQVTNPWLRSFAAPAVVYCTCFLGLTKVPGPATREDYSYGIYLFAFPIQQLVASFPSTRVWWINILVALPITVGVAVLSWHFIEKPMLRLRRFLTSTHKREVETMQSWYARFVIAWVILLYGTAVAAWGGLFSVFGSRLHDHLFAAVVSTGCSSALIASMSRRKDEPESFVSMGPDHDHQRTRLTHLS